MKKRFVLLLALILLVSMIPFGVFAEETAKEEEKKDPIPLKFDEKLTLDDNGKTLPIRRVIITLRDGDETYEITRVRLRDVAYALKDTEAKFDVSYDSAQNAVIITTGKAYSQVPLDEEEIDLTGIEAIQSVQKVLVDGKEVKLSAYSIGGVNYSSITALRKALGNKFFIRTDFDTKNLIISFKENDMEKFSAEVFDAKVKEKKYTLVYTWAEWCYWCHFNMPSLMKFQKFIEDKKEDVQVIALMHDYQDQMKADVVRSYQTEAKKDTGLEVKDDYPFFTLGMTKEGWEHISKIANEELMYLPSIIIIDSEGKLVQYLQGGEKELEKDFEAKYYNEETGYDFIKLYEEVIKK